MITRCPNCDTSFRVNEAQLNAANGAVRCGACLLVFSARDNLIPDEYSAAEQETHAEGPVEQDLESEFIEEDDHWYPATDITRFQGRDSDGEGDEPEDDFAAGYPGVDGEFEDAAVDDDELYLDPSSGVEDDDGLIDEDGEFATDDVVAYDIDVEPDEDDVELEAGFSENIRVESHPDEVVGSVHESGERHTALWSLGAVLMVVVLAFQVAWFYRDRLIQGEEYRGWFVMACSWLGCTIPDYRDPASLSTRSLVVRSHEEFDNALRVDALLRNDAAFRQAFPVLDLHFTNTRNEIVAARRFEPDDYLGGELTGLRYIPARTEVRLSLEIVDPGEDALGYSLTVAGHW